jgi:molybdenum cofactor cytidylyltransferase
MKFGPCPARDAIGTVLAHSLSAGSHLLKKGRVLSEADVTALLAAGIEAPTVAAAAFTGRCNVTATAAGLVQVNAQRLAALNSVDEGITLATLAPFARVAAGQMVATIKIIPFAVTEHSLATALELLSEPLVAVAPFRPLRASLILTELPGQKASVLEKRRRAVADRLERLGSVLAAVETVPHSETAVATATQQALAAGVDMVLVFGASAIVDRGDVIPAAVVRAGGRVVHLGMPVDPGNLLMLGDVAGCPVVGVPSCAASPKENGFDWVLERLCAGLTVTRSSIMAMGTGGLLMEIETRPQPRFSPSQPRREDDP